MAHHSKTMLSCQLLAMYRVLFKRDLGTPVRMRDYRVSAALAFAPLSSGSNDYSWAWLIVFLFLLVWALVIAVRLIYLLLTDETGLPVYPGDHASNEPHRWDLADSVLRPKDNSSNGLLARARSDHELVYKTELGERNKGASLNPSEDRKPDGAPDDFPTTTMHETADDLPVLRR